MHRAIDADGLFSAPSAQWFVAAAAKIHRSLSIVAEIDQIMNQEKSPLNSRAARRFAGYRTNLNSW
jgi:hypothetical protein